MGSDPAPKPFPSRLLLVFVIISVAIGLAGYLYYGDQKEQFTQGQKAGLLAIADLKVRQIESWRRERRADAEEIMTNRLISRDVEQFFREPGRSSVLRDDISSWLKSLREGERLGSVVLFDRQGNVRLSAPEGTGKPERQAKTLVVRALDQGEMIFADFHKGEDSPVIHLSIVVPIAGAGDGHPSRVGALFIELDPRNALYPLIETWPTPSRTAETLLVRRDNGGVVYLSELRHRKNAVLSLKFPSTETRLSEVMAISGKEGAVEGVDYRGVPVLAALRAVPDSPWFIVAKEDKEELYEPIRRRAVSVTVIVFLGILSAGAGIGLLWRQQSASYYRRQYEAEERYRSLFDSMREGFAYCKMVFEEGRPVDFVYLNVNGAFEQLTGLCGVTGKKVTEVIPGIRQADPGLFEIYGRVSLGGKPEKFERFVEGLKMWFSISVYSPEREFFVAVFDVITERKRAEQEMVRVNRTLRTLSGCNEALIRARDEEALLTDICKVVVGTGGYRSAWVGYAEEDEAKTVRVVAQNGFQPDYIRALKVTWADAEHGRGPTGRAIRSGKPCIVRDIHKDPDYLPWREMALEHGYLSSIATPLTSGGKVFGALNIYSAEPDPFHDEEVKLLLELTGDLAYGIMALRGKRELEGLYGKIKEEADISGSLVQILNALNANLSESELIRSVTTLAPNYLRMDGAAVFLYDSTLKGFTFAGGFGLTPAEEGRLVSQTFRAVDFPAVARTFEGEVTVLSDVDLSGPVSGEAAEGTRIGSLLIVPVSVRGKVLGAITSGFRTPQPIEFRDVSLLKGLADGVAIALQNSRLYRESLERLMELSEKIETIKAMSHLDKEILSYIDRNTILRTATALLNRVIPCDRVAVVLREGDHCRVVSEWGIGISYNRTYPVKDCHFGSFERNRVSLFFGDVAGHECPYHAEQASRGIRSALLVPLVTKQGVIGFIDIGSSAAGRLSPSNLQTAENIASQIAVALENARLYEEVRELLLGTISSLASAIDAKSPWTRGHSERVTTFAVEIGRRMGLKDHELDRLRLGGLLHDIGKIGTYDVLLDKPDKFTSEEFEIVKKHPGKGAEILRSIKQLADVLPAIRHHHERYDGKGYPDGLTGDNIPLYARILCAADSFDAMTADRPYRAAPGKEFAVLELKRCSGTQFDPQVVDTFLAVLGDGAAGEMR